MNRLFLLLKALKFGKILTTTGTLLVTVVAYSFELGWFCALGFVLLILVHKMLVETLTNLKTCQVFKTWQVFRLVSDNLTR